MRKRISIAVWLGTFLVLASAGAVCPVVWADAGPFSIGGRAVDYVPTDGKGEWKGGVQAKLNLPLFFAVQASADYRRDTFGSTIARDTPVQLSLLAYFLPKIVVVQPFVMAGGGWYHTTVDGPNGYTNRQERFGPHVGAGLEFNFTDHIFADATYQYVWLKDLHTVNDQGNAIDVKDRGHQITLGLNYRI